jgi:hypothetical protein
MRVLLVEPEYRKATSKSLSGKGKRPDDETLWYPPLGLMKLARYHNERGDEVRFVVGRDREVMLGDLFSSSKPWDRVYISTLFTYNFDDVVKTILFYLDAVGGTRSKVFVGGIMATLMSEEIYRETGIIPIQGTLTSARQIGMPEDIPIDYLPPDYSILDERYGIFDTYYAYTSRGCTNKCKWCGVPQLEPEFIPYIDIRWMIKRLRDEYGDKPVLKLMDNNILASPNLERIVEDLLELGYGRNQYTTNQPRRQRVVDFNQGLDATHLTDEKMFLLSKLNIQPMRIAFDRVEEKDDYLRALQLANQYGVKKFSNYMLYNFQDTPRDLYERLKINIELNEEWLKESGGKGSGKIYSYPMRYAPIFDSDGTGQNKNRDILLDTTANERNWLNEAVWTKRFIRNVEIMKGVANGAISPTPSLAWRTIGHSYEEFLENLYMPEELIRYRNRHERKVYELEPERDSGTGKVEEFRKFIRKLLIENGERFIFFHNAVSGNSKADVHAALKEIGDGELRKWLKLYVKREKSPQISLLGAS